MFLLGQGFQRKKSQLIAHLTIASHLNHFCFENFRLQQKKSLDSPTCLEYSYPSLELEKILRVTYETLFHSRLSCVMLARIKLWAAPKRNLDRRGAEERDACYA
jgi:hypothetical protein